MTDYFFLQNSVSKALEQEQAGNRHRTSKQFLTKRKKDITPKKNAQTNKLVAYCHFSGENNCQKFFYKKGVNVYC